jgi:hypothetical protein
MGLINPGGSLSNTFSSGVFTDVVEERTVGNGVEIEEILLKDGILNLAAPTPTVVNNGDLVYDSATGQFKGRIAGVTRNMANSASPGVKGAIGGKPPVYNNAASIILPAGIRAQDSTGVANIELASDLTVSLAVSGLGGLDTGSEASNTWYYLYLLRRTSTGATSAVFSTVNEAASGSISFPSSYDQKRQLPLAVRNDGSSNIIPFFVGYGWPYRPYIWYDVRQSSNVDGTLGTCNVLDNGTASSWTAISLASCVPPISRFVKLKTEITDSGSATVSIRKTGSTHEGNAIAIATGAQHGDNTDDWETNSSQQVDYITTGTPNNLDINVIGYTVTEVV